MYKYLDNDLIPHYTFLFYALRFAWDRVIFLQPTFEFKFVYITYLINSLRKYLHACFYGSKF